MYKSQEASRLSTYSPFCFFIPHKYFNRRPGPAGASRKLKYTYTHDRIQTKGLTLYRIEVFIAVCNYANRLHV